MQPPPPPPVIPAPFPPSNPYVNPARPNKTMAIWAICLSWIPLVATSYVAIGLGIAVLVKSRREKLNHGKVMAIIAIVIGVLVGGVMTAALVAGTIEAIHEDNEPARGPAQTHVLIDDLTLGECFNAIKSLLDDVDADLPDRVDVVPCARQHRYQVYATGILPDGTRSQIQSRAENFCRVHRDAVLKRFRGDTYEPGFLYGVSVRSLKPTAQCLVFRHDVGLWSGSAVRPGGSHAPDGDLDSGPTTQT